MIEITNLLGNLGATWKERVRMLQNPDTFRMFQCFQEHQKPSVLGSEESTVLSSIPVIEDNG